MNTFILYVYLSKYTKYGEHKWKSYLLPIYYLVMKEGQNHFVISIHRIKKWAFNSAENVFEVIK